MEILNIEKIMNNAENEVVLMDYYIGFLKGNGGQSYSRLYLDTTDGSLFEDVQVAATHGSREKTAHYTSCTPTIITAATSGKKKPNISMNMDCSTENGDTLSF